MPLLLSDKKNIAAMLVQKMGKPAEPMPQDEMGQPINIDSAMEAAGQSLIDAIKAGNAKQVGSAFIALCDVYELIEDAQEPQEEGGENQLMGC